MLPLLRKYKDANKNNLLLLLDFVTVNDYLFQLRLLAHCLQPAGGAALFYLAAAVSDFHIPQSRMSEHKIQSMGGGNTLTIVMDPVPKFLHHLVQKWAPYATIISFKVTPFLQDVSDSSWRLILKS
jgi:phosphopantothenate-cysteine ligase